MENPHRAIAISYWERKRLWYNVALIPPTLLGFTVISMGTAFDDYPAQIGPWGLGASLSAAVAGANVSFCLAYALEFLWGSSDPNSDWIRFWRRRAMVSGTLLAMVLAFIGDRSLGYLTVTGIRL